MSFESMEIDESGIDEYEAVQKVLTDYEKHSARLLMFIDKRAEMVGLLKIAQPTKIGAVRAGIAELDKIIADAEHILEQTLALLEKMRERVRLDKRMQAFSDIAEPEFLKYIAENDPKKLEVAKAMLEDAGGKTH